MENFEQIANLRRIMRRLALVVAVMTAVSLPLGYFWVCFSNQTDFLLHHTEHTAERMAEYAYVQGPAWIYAEERLTAIIAGTLALNEELHQEVKAPDGSELARFASTPEWPRHSATTDVIVSGAAVARVTAVVSMKPLVLSTVAVGLFGLLLGFGAWLAMQLLPLRALDETLAKLQASFATIEAHSAETTFAYEELKRQHRLVEETTQELMRARDQALAADRTKSAFLATMSHELRTPLNAIIGFSEMLIQEVFGPLGSPRYREYSQSICESGRHLLAVINDVLDISKVEAGKLQLHLESVDLAGLLESSSRLVRPKVFEAGVDLRVEPPAEPLPALRADALKLKQIVLNLLSNALKFTPAGGCITIACGRDTDAGGVYFKITDTGIGMTEAEIGVALLPFRQVDNSHTRKYEGTGLGLPLAKALAEQHGGRLKVESRPAEGTTVTVTLPQGAVCGPAVPASRGEAKRALKA